MKHLISGLHDQPVCQVPKNDTVKFSLKELVTTDCPECRKVPPRNWALTSPDQGLREP